MQTMTIAALRPADLITIERVRRNRQAERAGQLTTSEKAGIYSVNVDELLEIIEWLTRPNPAARNWEAEAAEREQFADVLAADEADQRRMDHTGTGWPTLSGCTCGGIGSTGAHAATCAWAMP